MELTEKTLSSEKIFDGRILHIRRDTVLLPNGTETLGLFATRTGSGMGTAGLVGPIDMLFEMIGAQGCNVWLTILWVVLFCFVLPALLTLAFGELFRKLKIIKYGDLTLKL